MEINTPIAEDIHTTDESANYDAACKRLLSKKSISACPKADPNSKGQGKYPVLYRRESRRYN